MSKIEQAAEAHTNLNIFGAVAAMMEGGFLYSGESAQETAQKIIKLCRKEQQVQLRIYDKAKGTHDTPK